MNTVIFCNVLQNIPTHALFRLTLSFIITLLSKEVHDYPLYYNTVTSVGIETDYGLGGPGIESRLGRDFSHTSRQALGPTQPPVQWVPGLSWG